MVETTQPFHTKNNPTVGAGTRSNHDVGVLLSLPVIGKREFDGPEALRTAADAAIAAMARDLNDANLNDANFYAADYAGKEQPQLTALY